MSEEHNTNRYKELENVNNIRSAATRHLNFGVAIFVMIFAYLIFVMITFAMKDKVNYTIAETGVLTHSNTFHGLIIKNEVVVKANNSGEVRFFFTEGARVRDGNAVATIMNDPEMAALLDAELFKVNQTLDADDPAFDESYEYLQGRIKNYVINQHNHSFESTYAIKNEITKDIENIRNTVILQQSSMGLMTSNNVLMLETALDEEVGQVNAPRSGLISFKMDGLEDITKDSFITSDLKREPMVAELSLMTEVKNEEPLFKVVDNYLWYVAAEIDDECEKEISEKRYIGVEFTDVDIAIDVRVEKVWDEGNSTYALLEFDRMLGEFLGERFVDFRIVYNEHEGVKIPETAVTTMEFAKIPEEYLSFINGQYRVHKEVYDEDAPGNVTLDGITVRIHKKLENGDTYIPLSNDIQVGDVLSYTDAQTMITKKFVIDDTEFMEGVFVVNKGYAMFKFIETMYQEMEYRIVEAYIPYGVRMYDRIATEGELTEEYQIIH